MRNLATEVLWKRGSQWRATIHPSGRLISAGDWYAWLVIVQKAGFREFRNVVKGSIKLCGPPVNTGVYRNGYSAGRARWLFRCGGMRRGSIPQGVNNFIQRGRPKRFLIGFLTLIDPVIGGKPCIHLSSSRSVRGKHKLSKHSHKLCGNSWRPIGCGVIELRSSCNHPSIFHHPILERPGYVSNTTPEHALTRMGPM